MDVKQTVETLVKLGYVGKNRSGKLIFLRPFYEQYGNHNFGAVTAIAVVEKGISLLPDGVDWEQHYMNFIIAAHVPSSLTSTDGLPYQVNAYSVAGMKAFKKAISSGYNLTLLTQSTQLYYMGKSPYKKTIGAYMSEELWRTNYITLNNAIAEGNLEAYVRSITGTVTKTGTVRLG